MTPSFVLCFYFTEISTRTWPQAKESHFLRIKPVTKGPTNHLFCPARSTINILSHSNNSHLGIIIVPHRVRPPPLTTGGNSAKTALRSQSVSHLAENSQIARRSRPVQISLTSDCVILFHIKYSKTMKIQKPRDQYRRVD